ncbi:MAG TPA: copper chaperone PCu(A)C [Terriglobales bacterium]|nr:copper chaperone PCu(A)C [Terriglobales bacterium]
MTRGALVLVALVLASCTYYPTIDDIGGIRIRPQNGRAVRQPTGLAVYMDLDSTGKYGDALIGASSEISRTAALVGATRVEVPGATLVRLMPQGTHIALGELTRAVVPGETVIVTVVFERLGRIGVPTKVVE